MPAHTHGAGTLGTNTTGNHSHSVYFSNGLQSGSSGGRLVNAAGDGSRNTDTAGNHSHTISGNTAEAGSGTPHDNVQPSLAVHMWERTA
jgi:microcystin-dependent protein